MFAISKLLARVIILAGLVTPCFGAFNYYRSVTLDNAYVTADQSNYPALITGTSVDLKTVANGGHVQDAEGDDIRFFSDTACTSALSYQRKSYTASSGAFLFWVKIPTLDTDADTVIYVCYGDASLTTDGSSTATWDSNFVGVWHFDGSLELTDATANGYTLSPLTTADGACAVSCPATTSGIVGNAALYTISGGWLGRVSSFTNVAPPFTMQCWVLLNGDPSTTLSGIIMTHGTNAAGGSNNGRRFAFADSGTNRFIRYTRGGIADHDLTTNTFAYNTSQWVFTAVTLNTAADSIKSHIGVSGTVTTQTMAVGTTQNGTPNAIYLEVRGADGVGAWTAGAGKTDECWFSNTDRSDTWLSTHAKMVVAAASFTTLGTETSAGGPFGQYILKRVQ